MSLLIAEIGNCHLGSMKLAKEMIRIAHESGADLIKGQAFVADDITSGSMPQSFYRYCAFTEDQYIELIEYARSIKNDMFYSIFSPGFDRLKKLQKWTKFAASQTRAGRFNSSHDSPWTVVSASKPVIAAKQMPRVKNAWPLYASDYMPKDPSLEQLELLRDATASPVGYSDHTIGIGACLKAIRWHNVNCIEKHFTLQKDVPWEGTVFRDTVHGASPRELERIAKALE